MVWLLATVPVPVWALVSAAGFIGLALAGVAAVPLLFLKPADPSFRKHSYWIHTPWCGFLAWSWLLEAATWLATLQPAPMRVAELASAYIPAQVGAPARAGGWGPAGRCSQDASQRTHTCPA